MSARIQILALFGAFALVGLACAGEQPIAPVVDDAAADARIHIRRNLDGGREEITIEATGNLVAWADVAIGMARARGYDASALEGVLPKGSFDITSKGWRRTSRGLDLALGSGARFETQQPPGESPRLVITLDPAKLRVSERRFKSLLRTVVRLRWPDHQKYGLILCDNWEKSPASQPLVIVIHGLDSRLDRFETLSAAIREAGLPCGGFCYPNDQTIVASARLLAEELKQVAKKHPNRHVALVTHSMGGLVAREVVENRDLDPGTVRQLIMIAPPNHGSALASLSFASDLWEHTVDAARRHETRRFYASVEDGLREAADDLRLDSPFLRQLNARPRNPGIRYTIFLGTAGPLKPEELTRLRASVSEKAEQSRWVRFFGPRIQQWLADLDEVVDGKGDGAVSLARGRLEGVDDTVELRFSHVGGGPDAKKVVEEIVRRLRTAEK